MVSELLFTSTISLTPLPGCVNTHSWTLIYTGKTSHYSRGIKKRLILQRFLSTGFPLRWEDDCLHGVAESNLANFIRSNLFAMDGLIFGTGKIRMGGTKNGVRKLSEYVVEK